MKIFNKSYTLAALICFVLILGSCRAKEGCFAEDYYQKSNSIDLSKSKKRKKSTLFSKKHRKRMKKARGKSY